jgi:cyclic pyranopterin phosphate synthase
LLKAGLDAVNISLDSTDRDTFRKITGFDQLDMVLAAIDAACASGIRTKINAVSLNLGEEAIWNLIDLAKDRPLDVRFIEMMPIGHGKDFPVYSHTKMLEQFRERYPDLTADKTMHGFGPAVYYHIPGYQGSIGLISPMSAHFCAGCNRLRMTADGHIRPCLHDSREYSIKGCTEEEMREQFIRSIRNKPPGNPMLFGEGEAGGEPGKGAGNSAAKVRETGAGNTGTGQEAGTGNAAANGQEAGAGSPVRKKLPRATAGRSMCRIGG